MPIRIDEMQTQVDVQSGEGAHAPERQQPQAEALPDWDRLARRQAELQARTAAWNFED
jgi:hypothetical protein